MKKVRYFLSSFLLLILCLDIIRLPITIFPESVSATTPLTIRTKYLEHLKEDGQKLAIKLDTSQKQLDRLDVIVQIEEGVDISKGLSLVLQNEMELESQLDEQGFPKEKLPSGFVKDEDYREEDVPKEFPEQEVAPTTATSDPLAVALPVYGLGYYSIKIKPEPERHIEWKVDKEQPERRYEEILLRLKIKNPLQTGQFMAVLSSDYKTILTEDWKTFEELVNRNSTEAVTDSATFDTSQPVSEKSVSDTEQPIPEISESISDNTQSNPVPEGEEVIQEEQALVIQTANLRLVLREHEEGVLQPSKPIAGAEFSMTAVGNYENARKGRTDEQGVLEWRDLPVGEYQISQITSVEGFEVASVQDISLQAEQDTILQIVNYRRQELPSAEGTSIRRVRMRRSAETPTTGTITVQLREYANNAVTTTAIQGSRFEIRGVTDPRFVREATTDNAGNLTISGIPFGEYEVVQMTTPDAYRLATLSSRVTLTANKQTGVVAFSNVRKNSATTSGPIPTGGRTSTTLRLTVVSSEDERTPIANASFLVTGSSGVRQTITTNAQGLATLSGLTQGSYTITQISSPEGYMASPKDGTFEIPPPRNEYAEFVDVKFLNNPYDVETYGKLFVSVFDNQNRSQTVPNVKLRLMDDLGNTYVGVSDINGQLVFKNLSKDRTYEVKIIEAPYEYEMTGTILEGNIRLQQLTNSQRQSMYLPRKQVNKLTLVNHEAGDTGVPITGSRFKLVHPDGSSREIEITNANGTIELNLPLSTDRDYVLYQLSTDSTHEIVSEPINIAINRPSTVYIPNKLKNPASAKVSVTFTKEWADRPASNQQVVVRLMRNGEVYGQGQQFTLNSSGGTQTKTFTDLPKYDANHVTYTYSVKEDAITDWYAEYKEVGTNQWKITNYEGSLTGVCSADPNDPAILWVATENGAYMLKNGQTIAKTIIFPTNKGSATYGYGIAYDRTRGYLYGVNQDGMVAIMDTNKGTNGTLVRTVTLGGFTKDGQHMSLQAIINNAYNEDGEFIHNAFRKVNSMETSVDGKYLFVKVLGDPNIYMYRLSDLTEATETTIVRPFKKLDARFPLKEREDLYTGISDGDIIQYPNGDILFTGHENRFFHTDLVQSPARKNFYFFLMKYNGQRDASGRVLDAGTGSYDKPIRVGSFRVPGSVNSFWDGMNQDTSIEGISYVDRFQRLFVTSVIQPRGGGTPIKTVGTLNPVTGSTHRLPNRNTNENTSFEFNAIPGTQANNIPSSTFTDMTGGDRELCNPEIIVRGAKSWLGDTEADRPASVEVELLADGQPYRYPNGASNRRSLTAENGWQYSFGNLPKTNNRGARIVYTVREVNPPANYLSTVIDYSITNTLIKDGFVIKKTNADKSQSLAGARFSLWNSDKTKLVASSGETNAEGVVSFTGLPAGTYYLREEQAPEDYQAAATEYRVVGRVNQTSKRVEFQIFQGNSLLEKSGNNWIVKNTKPGFKIKLVKIDAATGQKIASSTRFAIVNSQGQTINGQVSSFTNGEYLFTNSNSLFQAGTYYLKEETAPAGYERLTGLIPITIKADGSVVVNTAHQGLVDAHGTQVTGVANTIEIRIRNQRSPKKFIITKRIKGLEDQGAFITTSVSFRLTKDGDASFTPIEKTANANTNFVFDGLREGIYTLEETSPPQGYVKDKAVYKVEVGASEIKIYKQSNGTSSLASQTRFFKSADFGNINSGVETAVTDNNPATSVTYHNYNNSGNNIPANAYVGIDLGSVQNVTKVIFRQGGDNPLDRFNDFTIQYSIDGRTYIDLTNLQNTNEVSHATDIFARYIRIRNNSQVIDKWLVLKDIGAEIRQMTLEKTIPSAQADTPANIYLLGNIQNPFIRMEKRDSETGAIIQGTATFKLYKVPEDTTETTLSTAINDSNLIQTFQLANGQTGNETLLIKELGKYALVETQAPDGYIGLSQPVLLEATEARQAHSDTKNKHVTRFAVLSSSDKVTVDTSSTATDNVLKLQVKNRQKVYNLKILKRDAQNVQRGLTATFGLFNADGTSKIAEGQTSQNDHSYTFSQLRPGTYILKELQTPINYNPLRDFRIVIADNGQVSVLDTPTSMVEVGNTVDTTISLTIKNRTYASVSIQKVDKRTNETTLMGVRLRIQSKNGNQMPQFSDRGWHETHYQGRVIDSEKALEWNSSNAGNAVLLLPQGTYTISEISAPAGYERLQAFDITVAEDGSIQFGQGTNTEQVSQGQKDGRINIKLTNVFKPKIKITKVDSRDANRKLAGARFKLFGPDENTQIGQEVITGSNGEITLPGLEPGTYYLQESQPPTGYQANARKYQLTIGNDGAAQLVNGDAKIEIGASQDQGADKIIPITVKNERVTYNLKILKRDAQNAQQGLTATFGLFNADGISKIAEGQTNQNDHSYTFSQLRPGTYILKELQTPINYNPLRDFRIVIADNGQVSVLDTPTSMVEVGNLADNTISLTIKNRTFTPVSIQKVDKRTNETTLMGVRLRIKAKNGNQMPQFSGRDWHETHYQGQVIESEKALEWNSSNAGNAVLLLPQGTYTISEISAPAGYERLQAFDIIVAEDGSIQLGQGTNAEQVSQGTKDGRINIKLTNVFKPKIKITKVDSRDANRKLAGARFKLFGPDENTQIGQEVTTESNGEITLPGLEPGTYYLQESQPPTGYQANARKYRLTIGNDGVAQLVDGDAKIEIGTSQDQGADKVIPITVKNDRTPFTVKIRKRDYDETSRGVEARFQLYRKVGDSEELMQGMVGNTVRPHYELNLPNILPGTYVLKELYPVDRSYELMRPIQFTITEEGRLQIDVNDRDFASVENGGNTQELVLLIKNIKKFHLRIKKQDATNEQTLLDGARFTLHRAQDQNGGKLEQLATGVTANGLANIDVGPGYFILQETQAPTGYVLNDKEYIFQINHDGSIKLHNADDMTSLQGADSNRVVVFTMKNRRNTGQFKLAKRAYSNSDRRLAAVFELKEESDTATVVTKTTATDGEEIVFDNLRLGQTYQLKETQAPEGYQLNTKVYRLRLTDSGQVELLDGDDLLSLDDSNRQLLTAKNLKKGEYPKTGGFGVLPYITLGGGIMLLALAVELQKERRWKRIRK
ncbi:TPA: SpaA isopeptide-forming pilin-related protein [Streptococcus suis]